MYLTLFDEAFSSAKNADDVKVALSELVKARE